MEPPFDPSPQPPGAFEPRSDETAFSLDRDNLTLADLLVAGIALTVTYVAMTNVPGLLEFTVLGNLPLDKGARYAISTLSRYVIAILGLLFVGKTLGIHWSSIQWLIAAMGIGLGFGLQEIFANFISGII